MNWKFYWYVKRPIRAAARRIARRLPIIGPLFRLRFDLEFEAIVDGMSIKERVDFEGWKRKIYKL